MVKPKDIDYQTAATLTTREQKPARGFKRKQTAFQPNHSNPTTTNTTRKRDKQEGSNHSTTPKNPQSRNCVSLSPVWGGCGVREGVSRGRDVAPPGTVYEMSEGVRNRLSIAHHCGALERLRAVSGGKRDAAPRGPETRRGRYAFGTRTRPSRLTVRLLSCCGDL